MTCKHLPIRAAATLAIVFAVVASAAGAQAAPSVDRTSDLQRLLDRAVRMGIPGATVLVRDGKGTIRLVSGYGNVAKKTPIRATDRVRVGSLTKTYVSATVLQLVDEGKLSLDDSVEHWLPGLVPGGAKISVRQLLNMRAGLYDYLNEDKTILRRYESGDLTHRYSPDD